MDIVNAYKLIFAKNEIATCDLNVSKLEFRGQHYHENDKHRLIYAIVKAESEEDVMKMRNGKIREFREKTYREDFISLLK
jgi:hypothetical protein